LESVKKRNHSKDLRVAKRMILKWIIGKQNCEGEDWIRVAHERDRRRALVNTVMNHWVPYRGDLD
jgi:hypothetical protein